PPVVVTDTRTEQRAGDTPGSVRVVTEDDVRASASRTVDDLLRQVPGFSLFRRSSSMVGHPTTQGVSLRGIGPSGTSRALVLVDGVPVNDPFGGWVAWSRLPRLGIEQIEIVRGGGSSLWGNYAVGGIVHVLTRRPVERSAEVEASYGSYDTASIDARLTEAWGPVRLALEGRHFETGGYHTVLPSRRGPIDIDADSRHSTFDGRLELIASPDVSLFIAGNYFDEERGNGTALQVNRTEAGSIALGGRARDGDDEWRFTVFGQLQEFRSTFSAQAPDRSVETLALEQTVPSASAGTWLQWTRRAGDHLVSLGADGRWVSGETDERVFVGGAFARTRVAGGRQVTAGVFAQDVWSVTPALQLVAGARADYWRTYDATRRDTPPPAGVPARQDFDDVDRLLASPRLAALWHADADTDVRASVYQGFRAPTLNELYRLFRVRNDVTVANERLEPERVTGGEIGVERRWRGLDARVTGFWTEVTDIIANVTLAAPLPDCPPGTTCRQRQNLDRARVRGVEADVEYRPARHWRLGAGYLFSDARVASAPQQPALEGKRLAQVPEHSGSVSVRYDNRALLTAAASVRVAGMQYEDDLNTLPLGGFAVVDLYVARALAPGVEVFAAVENLFDRTYAVARTAEGTVSIGAPRLVHGGLRLGF
ncbi:MAG TPA: TonB-dependent receptor, partial [Candidatus Limnocylindria bacterium]|nr:TonB-dependent receptor [Candidatus Limnocylindria bacterium]